MSVWKDDKGRWHVQVAAADGRRLHRRCPPGASKAEAEQLEALLKRDRWLEKLGRKPPVLIVAALEAHLNDLSHKRSFDSARYHAYRLEPWVRGKTLDQAPDIAEQFKADARGDYAPATINRSLAALKRACTLALRRGWTDVDLCRKIELLPERNERHEYLSAAEVTTLANHDAGITDAVMISAYTGLRLGELAKLTPRNVVDGLIRLTADTKTARARSIPVAEAIEGAVGRLPIKLRPRTLQTRFKAACAAHGRPEFHWHDLRHTTASLLAQAGVSLYVIGAILGHSSMQTTARYAHLIEDNKREAIARIGKSAPKVHRAKKKQRPRDAA